MEETLVIGKPVSLGGTTTGGSFDTELRDILWSRATKSLAIGFAIWVLFIILGVFVFKFKSSIETPLADMKIYLVWFHPVSFGLALGMLLMMRDKACGKWIQRITHATFGMNIGLWGFSQVACDPSNASFFGLSLMLFIPAAFIPWKTRHQVGLGVVALVSYMLTHVIGIAFYPGVRDFWAPRVGFDSFSNHMLMSAIGIFILAAVATVISKTLYSLNRASHKMKRLGNYNIEKEIGRGGMGMVLLARHTLMCRPSAVKVMQLPVSEGGVALARFEREVNLSAHLTHPNTIQIYDFGRSGESTFYYAMEYLSGMDLQRLVEKYGPLSPERTAFILKQICGSLAEAHEHKIIHRDIKPSNIFLTERGGMHDFVKVLDFGLAKRVTDDGATSMTKTGMVFGTPRYISPEALYGDVEVDSRADIYNLGGVAYWLLTGKPPFDTSSSVDLIIDHVKTVPPRPREISETEIPVAFDDLVMKTLEKKPGDRYQTAGEMAEAVEALGLSEGWSWEQAKEWWELHGLIEEKEPGCA